LAEDLLSAIQTEQERLEQCNRDLHTVETYYDNRKVEFAEVKTRAEVRLDFGSVSLMNANTKAFCSNWKDN